MLILIPVFNLQTPLNRKIDSNLYRICGYIKLPILSNKNILSEWKIVVTGTDLKYKYYNSNDIGIDWTVQQFSHILSELVKTKASQ